MGTRRMCMIPQTLSRRGCRGGSGYETSIIGKNSDRYWNSMHSTHTYSVSKGCMDSYLDVSFHVCIACYDYLMACMVIE